MSGRPSPPRPRRSALPPDADKEKSPVAGDPKAVQAGKELFKKTCERCHGPGSEHVKHQGRPNIVNPAKLDYVQANFEEIATASQIVPMDQGQADKAKAALGS